MLDVLVNSSNRIDRSHGGGQCVCSGWLVHQLFIEMVHLKIMLSLKETSKIPEKKCWGAASHKLQGCNEFFQWFFVGSCKVRMVGGLVVFPWDSEIIDDPKFYFSQPGSSRMGDPGFCCYPQNTQIIPGWQPCCVKWLMIFFDNKPNDDLWSTPCWFILF